MVPRRSLPTIVAFAWILAAAPAGASVTTTKIKTPPLRIPTTTFQRPDPGELIKEAKSLWHVERDYSGALAKFNAAVDADPSDNDVRLQRGHFFEALTEIVVPQDRAKFGERARLDYERIADSDPESLAGGMARDGLTRLTGETFFAAKPVLCPSVAIELHIRADSLYGARQYAEAAADYEKATLGCPEAASWWVDLADSHYVLEEYARAKELFGKALTVDPWNREAHRFLADTELQLSNSDAAIHQLVLAVVSDPNYEAAWSALRIYATRLGRTWHRVYGDRKSDPQTADGAAWLAYRTAKTSGGDAQSRSASAFALEQAAVKSALKASGAGETGGGKNLGPFWSMMARAEQAGFLDEAIFVHMLDPQLAVQYPEFRDQHIERLVAYLETVIMESEVRPASR